MKRSQKRHAAAAAALLLLAALDAAVPGNAVLAQDGTAMGRYMEQDVTPDLETDIAYNLQILEDQTLRLVAFDESAVDTCVMDSRDGGDTWEKTYSVNELLGVDKSYCVSAASAPDGSVFLAMSLAQANGGQEEGAEAAQDVEAAGSGIEPAGGDAEAAGSGIEPAGGDVEAAGSGIEPAGGDVEAAGSVEPAGNAKPAANYRYVKITPEGTPLEVPLDLPEAQGDDIDLQGYLYDTHYAENGRILTQLLGVDNCFYLFDDETGELLEKYNEDEVYAGYVRKVGGKIFFYDWESIRQIDYETGEYQDVDAVLKETVEANKENLEVWSADTFPLVIGAGAQEGEIYYATSEGIFYYQSGGSVVERIADGALNSLSKPSVLLKEIAVAEDGSIFVMARDDAKLRLLRYRYDETAPTVPDTELRVYSLETNREVQQAISMFQTRNPQYYVTYEVGLTGDDAVTSSDALRTLNTEIVAGNGPDVLILDGMPVVSYMEKGILQDISSLIAEVDGAENLFQNIAYTYEKDGALYAVPSRFQVPVLAGSEETLAQVDSLTSLADAAEELRAGDDTSEEILNFGSVYWELRRFFCACSPSLVAADGSLNTEALTELITQMKRLLELNHYSEETAQYRYVTTMQDSDRGYDFTTTVDMEDFLTDRQKMEQINLAGGFELASLATLARMKQISYIAPSYTGQHVFVPNTIVGVSSQSAQPEGAKEFVKFLFSEEAQSGNQGGGFPVNRAAFAAETAADENTGLASASFTSIDEDGNIGEMVIYDIMGLTEEQKETFSAIVESLDTPSLTDAVIQDLVLEQAGQCLTGDLSVEDAVNAVGQKMSLYLAE